MTEDKYSAQKKYLKTKKRLSVWVDGEEYEAFKEKAKQNGTSVYAIINATMKDYLKNN